MDIIKERMTRTVLNINLLKVSDRLTITAENQRLGSWKKFASSAI